MSRFGQVLLIGLILTLTICGLNISNEAINQLTASQRPPVIGLRADESKVEFHVAGQQYTVAGDKLQRAEAVVKTAYEKTVNHLERIWSIFKVLFLT